MNKNAHIIPHIFQNVKKWSKKDMNTPAAELLKSLISDALEACTDLDLLDLIYKLLLVETPEN